MSVHFVKNLKWLHGMWRSCPPELVFHTTFQIMVVEYFRTTALLQVCRLWFGVDRGTLPVKHLAPQIPMAVDYCGRQPAKILDLAGPACLERKIQPPLILERTSIDWDMIGGLVGAVRSMLGREI